MSRINTIIPLVIVTGIGIFNGMYAFEPALREQKEQREKTFEKQHNLQPDASQDLAKPEAAANSAEPEKLKSIAPEVPQKAAVSKDASGSGSWFKSWGLAWPGSKANDEAEQPRQDAPKPLEQSLSATKSQGNSK